MPKKIETSTYRAWINMRARCRDTGHFAYPRYGGRGLKVCKRWDSFDAFLADMGERPPGLLLERIDNDEGYSPENCRWATRKEQQRNQRWTRYVTIGGKTYKAAELAELSGHTASIIVARAQRGLSYAEVIAPTAPATHCKRGHPLDEANTYIAPATGRRGCLICRRAYATEWNRQNR
jgi:hypothetical protein